MADSRTIYSEFRAALRAGKFAPAMEAATAMPGRLSLLDALELTLLAAEEASDNPKTFDALSARWAARVAAEKDLKLPELKMVVDLLVEAPQEGSAKVFGELSLIAAK